MMRYIFVDPANTTLISIIELHNKIIFYLLIIAGFVVWLLFATYLNKRVYNYISHGNLIEIVWTIIPSVILILIGLPSLHLLYLLDELLEPNLTIKVIGNQWYWSYEYSDYSKEIEFDSFMKSDDSLELGEYHNLMVEDRLVLPINTSIRLIVTSKDVIHSFAVPALGIKIDAIPGRLNSVGTVISRPGLFFGQCSELCGANHAFMPITIEAVNIKEYLNYLNA